MFSVLAYKALVRHERSGGPKFVLGRHEGGAGILAAGYAHETQKIGVVCTTAGPGATHLITSVACADLEHVVTLAITVNATLPTFGLGSFHETTMVSVAERTDTTVGTLHALQHVSYACGAA